MLLNTRGCPRARVRMIPNKERCRSGSNNLKGGFEGEASKAEQLGEASQAQTITWLKTFDSEATALNGTMLTKIWKSMVTR